MTRRDAFLATLATAIVCFAILFLVAYLTGHW